MSKKQIIFDQQTGQEISRVRSPIHQQLPGKVAVVVDMFPVGTHYLCETGVEPCTPATEMGLAWDNPNCPVGEEIELLNVPDGTFKVVVNLKGDASYILQGPPYKFTRTGEKAIINVFSPRHSGMGILLLPAIEGFE